MFNILCTTVTQLYLQNYNSGTKSFSTGNENISRVLITPSETDPNKSAYSKSLLISQILNIDENS
jgi:hypothetical protein